MAVREHKLPASLPQGFVECEPRPKKKLEGQRFGRLVAIKPIGITKPGGSVVWLCECDCGSVVAIRGSNLIRVTRSCGCLAAETPPANKTHGRWGTRVYQCYYHMRQRCYDERHTHYQEYGGRGIKVCDRWLNSFEAFLEDMGDPPSDSHTLDRIESDGDYGPGNCRWATPTEQTRNRRNTAWVTYRGERRPLIEWCEELGFPYQLAMNRRTSGWPDDRLFDAVGH